MHDFFRGWRRKVGCVTLVMACVVAGLWVRSQFYRDFVGLRLPGQHRDYAAVYRSGQHHIICGCFIEGLYCGRLTCEDDPHLSIATFRVHTTEVIAGWPDDPTNFWMAEYLVPIRSVKVPGCRYCAIRDSGTPPQELHFWIVPHWTLVIPLTLLSAYLILWKPRKRKAETDA